MIYGPMYVSDRPPVYQAMTQLPREKEEALIRLPYGTLIEFLHSKTPVSGTDSVYTAVQIIAREFDEKAIDKFLANPPKAPVAPTPRPEAPRAATARPAPSAAPAQASKPKPAGHPQPIINAKVAAAKAVGGMIAYSRASRAWEATMPNGQVHTWTAEFFRDASIEQIETLMKEHRK